MDISHEVLETGIIVISLSGRLDAAASPTVKEALQELIDEDQPKLIMDLQQVPFIDSSGLSSLVSALRTVREKGGDIVLSGVQSQARTIFHLTMLDRVFSIQPTLDDAKQILI